MKLAGNPFVMLRRFACWFTPVLLALTVLVPVTNRWIKLLQLTLLFLSILFLAMAIWRKPLWRWSLLVILTGGLILFSLPTRPVKPEFSTAFVRALERYESATYWWGGENHLGIDCSGLIRRGMMDAALREGLTTLNGGLLRMALALWWNDCSAKALGEGYRGWTVSVLRAKSINQLDSAQVRTGDLAIAGGGSHILACLGGGRWIQADPSLGKVVSDTAPSKNGWFQGQVHIVRWTLLSEAELDQPG